MPSRFNYKFGIEYYESFGFHIGLSFCIERKDINGKRGIYLMLYLGKIDLAIGYLLDCNEDKLNE